MISTNKQENSNPKICKKKKTEIEKEKRKYHEAKNPLTW
jgi:hypothetical protein